MVTRRTTAVTGITIRTKPGHQRDKSSGGVGNLCIRVMPACPFGSYGCRKDIIWEHGGLWSDNSVAMLAALFRIGFPLPARRSAGFATLDPRAKTPGSRAVEVNTLVISLVIGAGGIAHGNRVTLNSYGDCAGAFVPAGPVQGVVDHPLRIGAKHFLKGETSVEFPLLFSRFAGRADGQKSVAPGLSNAANCRMPNVCKTCC